MAALLMADTQLVLSSSVVTENYNTIITLTTPQVLCNTTITLTPSP